MSSLKALGEEIRTAKYEKISSYTFAQPDEVTKREKSLDTRFEELPQQATKKEGVLKVRVVFAQAACGYGCQCVYVCGCGCV